MIKKKKRGYGLVNKFINKLPFELHLPGYKFCGPGTRLSARLARGDLPKNQLDSYCKQHEILYSKDPDDIAARKIADRDLSDKAGQKISASAASVGEMTTAYAVTITMKFKSKLRMGLKKRLKSGLISEKKRIKKKSKKLSIEEMKIIAEKKK